MGTLYSAQFYCEFKKVTVKGTLKLISLLFSKKINRKNYTDEEILNLTDYTVKKCCILLKYSYIRNILYITYHRNWVFWVFYQQKQIPWIKVYPFLWLLLGNIIQLWIKVVKSNYIKHSYKHKSIWNKKLRTLSQFTCNCDTCKTIHTKRKQVQVCLHLIQVEL